MVSGGRAPVFVGRSLVENRTFLLARVLAGVVEAAALALDLTGEIASAFRFAMLLSM